MSQNMDEKLLRTVHSYSGRYLHFHVDEVELPNGKMSTRECVDHPGAVAVVPITDRGDIVMVKQFRYPVNAVTTEIPAGKLNPGENPLACAKRELEEETGYQASKWKLLTSILTAPGFTNEQIYIYMASGLTMHQPNTDEDEFVQIEEVAYKVLSDRVDRGEIQDAKTIIGIKMANL